MANLAFILFTLVSQNELNPRVFWVFSEPSCEPCVEAQFAVMRKWVRDQDIIVVIARDEEHSGFLIQKIHEAFPKKLIKQPKDARFNSFSTGWLWVDPSTGETVSYNASSGIYNSLKAKDMLRLIRD